MGREEKVSGEVEEREATVSEEGVRGEGVEGEGERQYIARSTVDPPPVRLSPEPKRLSSLAPWHLHIQSGRLGS